VDAEAYAATQIVELGGEAMRHFSVLLSAQSASNLKKNDHPLLAPTCAATLKIATPAKARLIRGIATAAIMLLTIPPITDVAEAGPGGGGGRGGGFGGHVGVGARGFAGRGGVRVLSAARASAVAELDRSEPAISPGGPLRRHGQAPQRRASLPITLQARA